MIDTATTLAARKAPQIEDTGTEHGIGAEDYERLIWRGGKLAIADDVTNAYAKPIGDD